MNESRMYRLRSGELESIPLRETPPKFTVDVLYDPELRTIVFDGDTSLQLISMDAPGETRTIPMNQSTVLTDSYFSEFAGRRFLLTDVWTREDFEFPARKLRNLLALDLKTYELFTVNDPAIISGARLTRGLAVSIGDERSIGLLPSDNGVWMMRIAERLVAAGPSIPPPYEFRWPKEVPCIYARNSRFIWVADEHVATSGKKAVDFRVFDRATGKWFPVQIPGNASLDLRAFGEWFAGPVQESLFKQPFRRSPGMPRPESLTEYQSVEDTLRLDVIYRPGTLFLYNAKLRRYYSWETHDGDCEVLLVAGRDVYYRVDRVIYRATIGEKVIEKQTVIAQGDNVRFIHFAFFGPSTLTGK